MPLPEPGPWADLQEQTPDQGQPGRKAARLRPLRRRYTTMRLFHGRRCRNSDPLVGHNRMLARLASAWQRPARAGFTLACTFVLLAGCGGDGLWEPRVDGNWKGQLVASPAERPGRDADWRGGTAPSRVLMRLEEDAGRIAGKFAQSSDLVAFGRLGEGGSRSVSVHAVAGIRKGADIQMRFSSDDGRAYEVQATIGADAMSGTYKAWVESAGRPANPAETGTFAVERY